jgi:hypothetical protein
MSRRITLTTRHDEHGRLVLDFTDSKTANRRMSLAVVGLMDGDGTIIRQPVTHDAEPTPPKVRRTTLREFLNRSGV